MKIVMIIIVILLVIGYATNSVTLTKKEIAELEMGGVIIRTFQATNVKKAVQEAQTFARVNNLRILSISTSETTWTGSAVVQLKV